MKTVKMIVGLSVVASLLIAQSSFSATTPSSSTAFTASQVEQIHSIVHDYLVAHPEVLVEASQALQAKTMAKMKKEAMTAIQSNKEDLFANKNTPAVGSDKPNVTMVEFFDYQCGHCKEMNDIVKDLIKENPNLRVVFKELPIFGANSQLASKAALAVNSLYPEKYFDVHEALLGSENPLSETKVYKALRTAGLSEKEINAVKSAMKDPKFQAQLADNFKLAQRLKLEGTPAFIFSNADMTDFDYVPGADTADNIQAVIKKLQ